MAMADPSAPIAVVVTIVIVVVLQLDEDARPMTDPMLHLVDKKCLSTSGAGCAAIKVFSPLAIMPTTGGMTSTVLVCPVRGPVT